MGWAGMRMMSRVDRECSRMSRRMCLSLGLEREVCLGVVLDWVVRVVDRLGMVREGEVGGGGAGRERMRIMPRVTSKVRTARGDKVVVVTTVMKIISLASPMVVVVAVAAVMEGWEEAMVMLQVARVGRYRRKRTCL